MYYVNAYFPKKKYMKFVLKIIKDVMCKNISKQIQKFACKELIRLMYCMDQLKISLKNPHYEPLFSRFMKCHC